MVLAVFIKRSKKHNNKLKAVIRSIERLESQQRLYKQKQQHSFELERKHESPLSSAEKRTIKARVSSIIPSFFVKIL